MSNFRHADEPYTRIRSFPVTFSDGEGRSPRQLIPPHTHGWHQLVYAVSGVVRVTAAGSAWIVPPHRAVWIPEGIESILQMHGPVALRMLYVRTGPRQLPRECAVMNMTPLLRELILRVNQIGALDRRRPAERRLAAVLVDELRRLRTVPLQLPLPSDPRAVRFAALAGQRPAAALAMDGLVMASGASRRTLERIFREETMLSLGQWVRRQAALHALALLGAGENVDGVARRLGYSSSSAFIAMFRRELGAAPGRYMANATPD